ncbi:Oligopeptide-binding protein AmiA [Dissostichus eleginoides]|uniref:Oligopeptide-binding protein AmiA n=1 Tax=Dissostichus eleginoides TaxID=100907 RepID=A0AAD9BFA2_DISEL|nr:Oligopeptide-binding protein AmiA [Dissostichus eleginoides]
MLYSQTGAPGPEGKHFQDFQTHRLFFPHRIASHSRQTSDHEEPSVLGCTAGDGRPADGARCAGQNSGCKEQGRETSGAMARDTDSEELKAWLSAARCRLHILMAVDMNSYSVGISRQKSRAVALRNVFVRLRVHSPHKSSKQNVQSGQMADNGR